MIYANFKTIPPRVMMSLYLEKEGMRMIPSKNDGQLKRRKGTNQRVRPQLYCILYY